MSKKTARKNTPTAEDNPTKQLQGKHKTRSEVTNLRQFRREIQIGIGLTVMTLLVFGQVLEHGFLVYDDGMYVYQNEPVKAGLTLSSLWWALTTYYFGNWHPVTWISHMLDCQFFGPDAGWHHFTSVLLHVANTLLVFAFLRMATRCVWRSALVAALFSLHPLHVESVAWIAERKDVLSTFFGLLALLAYLKYAKQPSWKSLLWVGAALGLGLMSKSMLVTLPFVLLLLDYWPLGRWSGFPPEGGGWASFWPLVREKIPLWVLAVLSSVVTYSAQQQGGAVKTLDMTPLSLRVENALVSYVQYLFKTVWPHRLAVLYPFPKSIPLWQAGGAALLLLAITALVILKAGKHPYLPVGWLWFLGTLVPVIGLLRVGEQAMADRYTYLPLIGLFVMGVWGAADLAASWTPRWSAVVSAGVLALLAGGAFIQVGYWKDNVSLFRHAVEVTTDNPLCDYNLALALYDQGKTEEAITYYLETVRLKPDEVGAQNNLGSAYYKLGKYVEAADHFAAAARLNPNFAIAHTNLGLALYVQGKTDEAIACHLRAIDADPRYADARYNLGLAYSRQGKVEAAIECYSAALQLNPNLVDARNQLNALQAQSKESAAKK